MNNSDLSLFSNFMTIIYNMDKRKGEIKLFGEKFVENNKDKCYLIIEGIEDNKYNLSSVWDLNLFKKGKIKISLTEIEPITNMSYIFYGCSLLKDLPDISNWDTSKVTNMSNMFFGCISLKTLPDISNWDTKNVTNMHSMFYDCSSLNYLPDISKWNTKNVRDMSYMFDGCCSLNNLPDISKWDTTNVTNMSFMFFGCNKKLMIPKKFME